MIKFVMAVMYLLLVGIVSLPLYLVVNIIGKFNERKKVEVSQKIVAHFFRIMLAICGVKVDARGLENVPKDEAVVFMANHRGYFDILSVYATVPTLVGFISKKEIKKIPSVGVWMKYINCLFLDRDDKREGLKTILEAIDKVKNGYSMFIMPEGSRSKTYEMLPFKKGSFKIAEKANCKILPVAIANSAEVFEKHFPFIRPAHVTVYYGKPFYIRDLEPENRKHAGAYTREVIRDMLEEIK